MALVNTVTEKFSETLNILDPNKYWTKRGETTKMGRKYHICTMSFQLNKYLILSLFIIESISYH